MQRYRPSFPPSLLFEIMNSAVTCPCSHCSAEDKEQGVTPWNHNRNTPLEGLKDMRETSFTKCPFPNRVGQTDLLEKLLPRASSGGICSTGTANLNSPAWTFPSCGFNPCLLLSIKNSPSAMTSFKPVTWQIMPLCILHALHMNFTLAVVIPPRIANSVTVRLFRTVQHLGALNHCQ